MPDKNTVLKYLIYLFTFTGTIIGSFLTVDSRYAHSDEVSKLKTEQQQVIIQNRYDLLQSSNLIRKQMLEDKIFDLQLIPEKDRTQYDKAKLNKYQSDIKDINDQLNQQPPNLNKRE